MTLGQLQRACGRSGPLHLHNDRRGRAGPQPPRDPPTIPLRKAWGDSNPVRLEWTPARPAGDRSGGGRPVVTPRAPGADRTLGPSEHRAAVGQPLRLPGVLTIGAYRGAGAIADVRWRRASTSPSQVAYRDPSRAARPAANWPPRSGPGSPARHYDSTRPPVAGRPAKARRAGRGGYLLADPWRPTAGDGRFAPARKPIEALARPGQPEVKTTSLILWEKGVGCRPAAGAPARAVPSVPDFSETTPGNDRAALFDSPRPTGRQRQRVRHPAVNPADDKDLDEPTGTAGRHVGQSPRIMRDAPWSRDVGSSRSTVSRVNG